MNTHESHQRKLVDSSDPAYKGGLLNLRIPPTAEVVKKLIE